MRAHVLALAVYVALLAAAGTLGAYELARVVARIVIGLGG